MVKKSRIRKMSLEVQNVSLCSSLSLYFLFLTFYESFYFLNFDIGQMYGYGLLFFVPHSS